MNVLFPPVFVTNVVTRSRRLLSQSLSFANVIAACAMILTGVQAWTTVYTAKIQTIPDLQFFEAIDLDGKPGCGEVDRGIDSSTSVLCVENSGTGPARVISMAASFDEHTFEIPSVDWAKISDYLPEDASRSITFSTKVVRSQTLAAGKSIPLVRYRSTKIPAQSPMHQLIASGRFNMSFCYCNFYHDCQNVSLTAPNAALAAIKCESSQKRWWRILEPTIKLPAALGMTPNP